MLQEIKKTYQKMKKIESINYLGIVVSLRLVFPDVKMFKLISIRKIELYQVLKE